VKESCGEEACEEVVVLAGDILRHPPLVGHELLPADVTRVSRLQANRPIRDRHFDGSTRGGSGSGPVVDDRLPSIGRILI
jgi:hypothetical protein